MKLGNRLVVLFVFAVVASLLLLSGCKGKEGGTNVDLTTPPPLPEEGGSEGGEQSNAPAAPSPASPSGQQSQNAQPGLPLLS